MESKVGRQCLQCQVARTCKTSGSERNAAVHRLWSLLFTPLLLNRKQLDTLVCSAQTFTPEHA